MIAFASGQTNLSLKTINRFKINLFCTLVFLSGETANPITIQQIQTKEEINGQVG
jgi:hypothetical protein